MPNEISTSWTLAALIIFLAKHLLADFFFQTAWMANGKEQPEGWLAPLAVHAAIHAALTAVIFAALAPHYLWIAILDFVVHCIIDRAKGLLNRFFENNTSKTGFWWLLGIDQTLHHLTHLAFAILIAVLRTP